MSLNDYAFVYRIGEKKEIALGEGSYRVERLGVRADEGWGTLFTPDPAKSYRIQVRASWKPETTENYKVRLVAKGGGWKA
jgi:hypothetical protein